VKEKDETLMRWRCTDLRNGHVSLDVTVTRYIDHVACRDQGPDLEADAFSHPKSKLQTPVLRSYHSLLHEMWHYI